MRSRLIVHLGLIVPVSESWTFIVEAGYVEEKLRVLACTFLVARKRCDPSERLFAMDFLAVEEQDSTVCVRVLHISRNNFDLEGLILIDTDVVLCWLVFRSRI